MKALTRRIVTLAVVVTGPVFFFACGQEEVGVTGEEIKVGTWAPLSGPATDLAVSAKAIQAYFQYVNDQGGVKGRKLTLVMKDDAYDPTRTPQVVKELVEQDQVFAIIGGTGTANCMAVKDYLAQEMIPWINPGSGSRIWTTPVNAYRFSVYPSYVTEGLVLGKYAVEELGANRVGLFFQDDAFGHEGQEGARLALSDADKELVVSVPYDVSETDFSSHAKKLRDAVADTVMLWAIPSKAALLLQEIQKYNDSVKFRSQEFHPKLLGSGVLADPIMSDQAGGAWEGAIIASSVPSPDSDEPGVASAREILSKYAPDVPFGIHALMGIIRAQIFVEGLKRIKRGVTRLGLILALEGLENWSDNVLGQPITFNKDNHQGFDSVRLLKVEKGKYVTLTGWLRP